jgi:hypothetical protein
MLNSRRPNPGIDASIGPELIQGALSPLFMATFGGLRERKRIT